MKKDQIITLEIEDLTGEGLGIGHAEEGMAVFVKDALIGDKVEAKVMKVKKTYAFARLMNIIRPGEGRVEPKCSVARPCGGCQIQMMDYEAQLRYKEKKVADCMQRIGGIDNIQEYMQPILGMKSPWHYRNKAQFPVQRKKDGELITGFYAGRTHSIVPCMDCQIGIPENETILQIVMAHMEKYGVSAYDEMTGKGLVRHVMIRKGFATGQIMVCLVVNGKKVPEEEKLAEALRAVPGMTSLILNENREKTNVIFGRSCRTIWGEDAIEDKIGDLTFSISPRSFYQVNPVQTEKLYGKALEKAGLTGEETVWDIYCGIGTISLFLAEHAKKVYGVEVVPEAIENAKANAARNHLDNAEFFVGKAEEVLPEKYKNENIYADVIVIDPPRAGCEQAVLDTMLSMAPKRIVYVSCDPATLARDSACLIKGGYHLQSVQPVDMFPHTTSVENVAQFLREA